MTDRTPTKILENGAIRYGIYGEDGTLLRYAYIRPEDEPTDEGTPLNSNTLLKPSTAQRLGLETSAFPDDALNALEEKKADADKVTALATGKADLDADTGTVPPAQLPPFVSSFHGRTGAVAPAPGDYTAADITGLPGTDYGTSRVRGIAVGTVDLTAGSSNLESGTIYLVYQ